MNKLEPIVKNLGVVIGKNSPHILTGLGCAGLVSTAILTGKATPRAMDILEEERSYRRKKDFVDMKPFEKVKLTWKCYIPAGVVGLTSIGCIIGANTISMKRNAALAALYTISETAFRDYKTKVVEQLGKSKDTAIRDDIAKDRIAKNPLKDGNIIMTGDNEVLCYDMLSGRYFKSTHETIRQKINDLNYDLRSEMWLNLNDLYYALGLPSIELGNLMGFKLEEGQIEPLYSSQLNSEGKPCLVIDVDVYPKYTSR